MLAAKNRITRSDGFSNTLRLGSRSGSRALVVYLAIPESESDSAPRAGFVVGKRQVRKATARNQVKRRLRHVTAELLGTLPSGSTLVVRGLGPSAGMTSDELRRDLKFLLQRSVKRERDKGRRVSDHD